MRGMSLSDGSPARGKPRSEDPTTLRMSPMELARLKRELDASAAASGSVKRAFKRWPFETRSIRMELQHPGGAATTLNYVPRNISREGMGLLHSSFVYTGTRCTVFLPHPARGQAAVGGTVVRCRHFRGKIHEIGVRFDQPIDVREFLGLDGSEECYMLESVNPTSLTGSMLLIEPGKMDRALIRQHLVDTNLTVTAVDTVQAGVERAGEGYDIILCSLNLPDGDGLLVLYQLRTAGIQTPFLLLCSSAGTAAFKDRLRTLQPDGVLCKPVPSQTLLAAMGEFLLMNSTDAGGGGAALFSSLSSRDAMMSHVPEYLVELRQIAKRINGSLNAADVKECTRLIFQIRGSAQTFGFAPIAEAAALAQASLQSTHSLSDSSPAIRQLVGMCARAQVHRQAA